MDVSAHNRLVSFIWSIADDCLRDVYVRGKYRDVILPMVVLRRLDVLLEDTKEKVQEEVAFQKEMGNAVLEGHPITAITGYVFYNTSRWTLKLLSETAGNSNQILQENFMEYLDGYSENIKEIINCFKLRSQIRHMASKDVLLNVLNKFTSPDINLTHEEKEDSEGRRLPALSNLGMGYVFEELIRKFNEENNEEAGEHFTPREVIELMTNLVILPVKDNLPNMIQVYDPACGSGGMLTEAQNFIIDPDGLIAQTKKQVQLYGKEINDETYAICKSDMMIKGNDPENIRVGSTLSTDEFAGNTFDFMMSNPPYGKSWSSEMQYIKEGKDIIDTRFEVELKDYWLTKNIEDATPRSSDGQLLFLMEMISKMKPTGSRIASVHNGSSLFTGDAGSGESNIRRYIIENDLLEAIIQLPNNLFYNTGITTYVWLLSNNKTKDHEGKVILIDANEQYTKLRKNLGDKNCELQNQHIKLIYDTYRKMSTTEAIESGNIAAQVFDNTDFGYYKVIIERPSRLKSQFSEEAISALRFDRTLLEPMQWAYQQFGDAIYLGLDRYKDAILKWADDNDFNLTRKQITSLTNIKTWKKGKDLYDAAHKLMIAVGTELYMDHNLFVEKIQESAKELELKITASQRNAILSAISEYDVNAEKVIKKVHKFKTDKLKALLAELDCTKEQLAHYGYFPTSKTSEYIEYESQSDLRDSENIALKENIYEYFLREVHPYVEEAWINIANTRIGYEISFNKYFYRHQPLRSMEEVAADILKLEEDSDGLIREILGLN